MNCGRAFSLRLAPAPVVFGPPVVREFLPAIASLAAAIRKLPASLTMCAAAGSSPKSCTPWASVSSTGRATAFAAASTRGHDPQLPGRGGIRPAEDRGGDIGRAALRVRCGQPARGRRRDRAHRKVDPAAAESGRDAVRPQDNLLERTVVGQEGDDDRWRLPPPRPGSRPPRRPARSAARPSPACGSRPPRAAPGPAAGGRRLRPSPPGRPPRCSPPWFTFPCALPSASLQQPPCERYERGRERDLDRLAQQGTA